jgi:alpha-galactosidase
MKVLGSLPAILLAAAAISLLIPGTGLAAPSATPAASPSPTPDYTAAIRTPPAPETPRINGPRVYGERPGHPFLYHLPVTGRRPITISAQGLPDGLAVDPSTGNITGTVAKSGTDDVLFTASNALGSGSASIRFVIGPDVCLTPPLGWNSWNAFHVSITDAKIRAAADAMAATGLIDHGWTYINMDDRWQGARGTDGVIKAGKAFPDMKALADYIHAKGLKVGIYSSPGPLTCANAIGSYKYEDQDAATYAAWGMDYLKYDWCSYRAIEEISREQKFSGLFASGSNAHAVSLATENAVLMVRRQGDDPMQLLEPSDDIKAFAASTAGMTRDQISARVDDIKRELAALHGFSHLMNNSALNTFEVEQDKAPYVKMRASLDKVNRDIVFSFCQYGMGKVWEWGAAAGGNLWRTTGDISANWPSIETHGFNQNGLEQYAGPGHWNDPDMLEIGNGNLTADENYTHMTLWCMLSAPLLIGCDMPKMSPFIISLFTNDEVLAVSQDALGKQGWRAHQDGKTEVWTKPLADGSMAVAFFNRGDAEAPVSINWSDLKLTGPQSMRDLWRQKDTGVQKDGYTITVAPHGAELFKVSNGPS